MFGVHWLRWFLLLSSVSGAPAPKDPLRELVATAAASGRIVNLAETPSARVSETKEVPVGAPPLLSFRYYEGQVRHRFGNNDLVLDDAGH